MGQRRRIIDKAGLENAAMGDNGDERMVAVVRGSGLNLREWPRLNESRVLAVMPAGTKVKLSGDFTEGFAKLTFNEMEGWAFLTYLEKESDQTPVHPIARVDKYIHHVYLRDQPRLEEGPVLLAEIPGGAPVAVLGEEMKMFVPVSYEGIPGYVQARFPGSGFDVFIFPTSADPWAQRVEVGPPPVEGIG
jgi:hypothetical protein